DLRKEFSGMQFGERSAWFNAARRRTNGVNYEWCLHDMDKMSVLIRLDKLPDLTALPRFRILVHLLPGLPGV
ncbi:MAG: hypothetical protein ABIO35_12355, partial [Nitrobacter sp.]